MKTLRSVCALTFWALLSLRALAEPSGDLVKNVRSTWRAQDGETADQIIGRASKAAHFITKDWEIVSSGEGRKAVSLSWVKHANDKADDQYTISWQIAPDGSMAIEEPYAKPMELGWQPFAISLIAAEINDEEKHPNIEFLRDPSNFNFIETAKGKLGDLLKSGRCTITRDPVDVSYIPSLDNQPGDFWHLQMQVNCDIPGPEYFTRGGVILFDKHAGEAWRPASFFAHRIVENDRGHWFDKSDVHEQEVWQIGRDAFERAGMPVNKRSPFPN